MIISEITVNERGMSIIAHNYSNSDKADKEHLSSQSVEPDKRIEGLCFLQLAFTRYDHGDGSSSNQDRGGKKAPCVRLRDTAVHGKAALYHRERV